MRRIERTARTPKKCSICGRPILPKEKYIDVETPKGSYTSRKAECLKCRGKEMRIGYKVDAMTEVCWFETSMSDSKQAVLQHFKKNYQTRIVGSQNMKIEMYTEPDKVWYGEICFNPEIVWTHTSTVEPPILDGWVKTQTGLLVVGTTSYIYPGQAGAVTFENNRYSYTVIKAGAKIMVTADTWEALKPHIRGINAQSCNK